MFPLVLLTLLVGVTGCSRDEAAYEPNEDDSELRIVSFMPSATRIVADLGLGDRIVGVAEHDAAAPAINADGDPMPIVGHFMDVDTERLLALRPTHVIFPGTQNGSPIEMAFATELPDLRVVQVEYPDSVREVIGSVIGIADGLGLNESHSASLLLQMNAAMGAAAVSRNSSAHPSDWADRSPVVLSAFSVDPVVASGPETVNHELLVVAGGVNALADAAVSAVTLDREALINVNPDVIVLLLPGASEAEAAEKTAWFDGLPIAAVEDGRVHALTDPQVLLPATNLPEVLEDLREVIWQPGETENPAHVSEGAR